MHIRPLDYLLAVHMELMAACAPWLEAAMFQARTKVLNHRKCLHESVQAVVNQVAESANVYSRSPVRKSSHRRPPHLPKGKLKSQMMPKGMPNGFILLAKAKGITLSLMRKSAQYSYLIFFLARREWRLLSFNRVAKLLDWITWWTKSG